MIRELTEHPGWQFFIDRCQASMYPRQRRILNGQAATIEDYRTEAGWIAGADFVLKIPEQVEIEVATARAEMNEDKA